MRMFPSKNRADWTVSPGSVFSLLKNLKCKCYYQASIQLRKGRSLHFALPFSTRKAIRLRQPDVPMCGQRKIEELKIPRQPSV